MPGPFDLHPRLAADTFPVGDLALCTVRLMNDGRFPWLVLVPRRPGLVELTDLGDEDARQLTAELRTAIRVLQRLVAPDKVNVGALGNLVPQLHLHVVARFRSDPAWPGPVWGAGDPRPYPAHAAGAIVDRAAAFFAEVP